jgi:chromatin remodeling complex protein RSC6
MAKKTASKTDVSKAKAAKEPTKDPVPVEAAAATVAATNDVVETDSSVSNFADLLKRLGDVTTLLAAVKQEARALEKRMTRELKAAQKACAKKKAGRGNRSPSGFVKPTLITDELASFLGKESGTQMARTEVTREINRYIRENNLQDPKNGRKINPDAKLSKLLNISKKDELTYFNLQRYMSPHFAKQGVLPTKEGAPAKA